MSASAIGTLVWRHPLAEVAMKAAAPIGAAFTFLCLVTGSLWGQSTWGTWWVWDARLTSVLVLFIMYLGVIALWRAMDDPGRAAPRVAVLVLVGAVNIPIIKFSVEWFNTLHQPASVLRMGGSTIDRLDALAAARDGRSPSPCSSPFSISRRCATRSCAGASAPCASRRPASRPAAGRRRGGGLR